MRTLKILFALLIVAGVSSCEDEKSLQKYYVENQEDSDFLALDVPTSMFTNSESLDEEQKATIKTIKKINVLALKADQNREKFEEEKVRLSEIFSDERYQLLMKYGGGNKKAAMYFTGEDDAIDELIVYGYDDERGLGVARVLGEDMNPEMIMKLIKSMDGDEINVEGISGIGSMFDTSEEKDSTDLTDETNTEVIDSTVTQ